MADLKFKGKEEVEKYKKVVAEIKKRADKALKSGALADATYSYTEDSFGTSIEPKYFTFIELMGAMIGKLSKRDEQIGSTVMSSFFSDIANKRINLERRSGELMGTINTLVRTVMTLLYDLRDLESRIRLYEKEKDDKGKDTKRIKQDGMFALKRIWMDEVDIKKGNGSIHNLATSNYEYISLRDLFMAANTIAELEKPGASNERVKRIAIARLKEFLVWLEESEKELKLRKELEKTYLISEVNSLKMYAQWATPYLKAAQKLSFRDIDKIDDDAEMINAFDQNSMSIKVRATKEFSFSELYKGKLKLTYKPSEKAPEDVKAMMKMKEGPKAIGVCDAEFTFRTRPSLAGRSPEGGSMFRNMGKLTIKINSWVMTPEDYEYVNFKEKSDALDYIEGVVDTSLGEMRDQIESYLVENYQKKEEKKEEKKAEPKPENPPLLDMIFGSNAPKKDEKKKDVYEKVKEEIFNPKPKQESFFSFGSSDKVEMQKTVLKYAQGELGQKVYDLYNTFKKTQGLPAT